MERETPTASSPTLCGLESRADRETAVAIHRVLVEQFIASFAEPPTELILDFDATGDPVHGNQEGRFFHGYYKPCDERELAGEHWLCESQLPPPRPP